MRTRRSKSTDWRPIVLTMLLALVLNACGSGGGADSAAESSGDSGSLVVKVTWLDAPGSTVSSSAIALAANMICNGISTVEVQVYGPPPANTFLARGGPWPCDQGRGQISNIPATNGCTVVLIASNADGQIVYHGSQDNVNIIAGQTTQTAITAESFVPEMVLPTNPTPQTSVTCQWVDVAGAQTYELRLSTDPNMSPYSSTTTHDTRITPGGLTAGISYYCQVAAKDRFGNLGSGSNILSFSVLLGSPTLIAPARGAVVLPGDVTCNWLGPDQNLAYHLTVATNLQLTSPLVDLDLPSNTTSYLLSDLAVSQTYYWQVAALDAQGQPGPPSDTFYFTPSEADMQLTAPLNGAVLSKEIVRLEWELVPLADTQYRVTLSTADDPEHPIDQVTTASTFFESSRVEDGVNYVWQVERLNSAGEASHISPRWQFGTLAKPALIAPGNNSSRISGGFDFAWQNIPDNGYQILIGTDPTLSQVTVNQILAPDTNTYHANTLSAGQSYYWQIRPIDSEDAIPAAYASEIWSVKTLGTPPVLSLPINGVTTVRSGIDFSWSAVTHAAGYTLYISKNINPQQSPAIKISQTVTNYHLSDLSLENGTRYYWQVFANDSSGRQGAGSSIFSFQTVVSHQAEPVTGADPRTYIPFGDYFFYVAREDQNSSTTYLWRRDGIDGSPTKIQNLININGQPETRDVQNIHFCKVIGQTLYFSSYAAGIGHEVCRITDPAVSQVQVFDLIDTGATNIPSAFIQCGSLIFYVIQEGDSYTNYNVKLRYYDYAGNSVGTAATGFVLDDMQLQLATADKLFFSTRQKDSPTMAEYGMELWVAEVSGTSLLGTHMVKDIEPGEGSSYPGSMLAMDGFALFVASDSLGGRELWRTDGTTANTTRVKDICPGSCSGLTGLAAKNGGLVYFWADDSDDSGDRLQLWKTDGTSVGTQPIEGHTSQDRITSDAIGSDIAVLNGELYFRAVDSTYGNELRRSDGTFAGTQLVLDIWPGPNGTELKDALAKELAFDFLFVHNGYIYFRATEPTYGDISGEIWRTDGTPEGTEVIEAIAGPQSSFPINFKFMNDILYFGAGDPTNGWEAWQYQP